MKNYGLIGKSLKHSFSKKYFENKFQTEQINSCNYQLYEIEDINKISKLVVKNDLAGFNVTIPYKQSIIPYLTKLSDEAEQIGAVNTVLVKNRELWGFNTDSFGFQKSIEPLLTPLHKNALILGTGGASKAVAFVFKSINIPYTYVSRIEQQGCLTYDNLEGEIEKYQIIVNCTPLGTYPNINESPKIPYQLLNSNNLLYDLVYNPKQTMFMQQGLKQGTTVKNGYEMLVLQAEKGWQIWNNH